MKKETACFHILNHLSKVIYPDSERLQELKYNMSKVWLPKHLNLTQVILIDNFALLITQLFGNNFLFYDRLKLRERLQEIDKILQFLILVGQTLAIVDKLYRLNIIYWI